MVRRRRLHEALALVATLSLLACGEAGSGRGEAGAGAVAGEAADTGSAATPATQPQSGIDVESMGAASESPSTAASPQATGSRPRATRPSTDTGPHPDGRSEKASEAPPFEGTTGITSRRAGGSGVATLTGFRTGRQDGFDRVVFEFAGNRLPGYHIEYSDTPARHCGSGLPVRIAGGGLLSVRMAPARAHDDAGNVTVAERDVTTGLTVIERLAVTCDFEAEVAWVIGVAKPNGYRVLELIEPTRLVIDVLHR